MDVENVTIDILQHISPYKTLKNVRMVSVTRMVENLRKLTSTNGSATGRDLKQTIREELKFPDPFDSEVE
jgi:hypothetical protein